MGYVLTNSATYEWPVEIRTPAADGSYKKFDFVGEFKRHPQSRIDDIHNQLRLQAARKDLFVILTDDMLIDDVFVGWTGITDPAGSVVQVTPENRSMLLEIPGMKKAVISAWFEVVNGIERKNS